MLSDKTRLNNDSAALALFNSDEEHPVTEISPDSIITQNTPNLSSYSGLYSVKSKIDPKYQLSDWKRK